MIVFPLENEQGKAYRQRSTAADEVYTSHWLLEAVAMTVGSICDGVHAGQRTCFEAAFVN